MKAEQANKPERKMPKLISTDYTTMGAQHDPPVLGQIRFGRFPETNRLPAGAIPVFSAPRQKMPVFPK
ncbi:MAG: hypothetical protein WEB53_16110 [Akkermansiaceae bacterium]